MDVTITLATSEDLDSMVEIHCQSWKHAYHGIIGEDFIARKNKSRREKWAMILSGDNNKHYLIRDGGVPVGMVSIDRPREAAAPDTYEIFGLYILPDQERKGYGSLAVEFVEETVRNMGYRNLSLWVLEPNLNARHFYEKHGFAPDGTEKLSYYDKPINLLRYGKPL